LLYPQSGEKAYYIETDINNPNNILGEGQFSKVFKVRRCCDGQIFAAKVFKINKEYMSQEEIDVAEREISVLKSLETHPMII
jgi:hypothetical protein